MNAGHLAAFALHVLRLQPSEIWRCPVRELLAYADAMHPQGMAPGKADLAALMLRYPDGDEGRSSKDDRK